MSNRDTILDSPPTDSSIPVLNFLAWPGPDGRLLGSQYPHQQLAGVLQNNFSHFNLPELTLELLIQMGWFQSDS